MRITYGHGAAISVSVSSKRINVLAGHMLTSMNNFTGTSHARTTDGNGQSQNNHNLMLHLECHTRASRLCRRDPAKRTETCSVAHGPNLATFCGSGTKHQWRQLGSECAH